MKKIILLCFILFVIIIAETIYIVNKNSAFNKAVEEIIPKPLLSYTFANLAKTKFSKTQIILGSVVSKDSDSFSQIFFYSVPKTPGSKVMEKVSGLVNFPNKSGNYPVIVMFRGFVPDNIYEPGIGTEPVAAQLVKNGYITLAPDFLGYGKSASPSTDPFENRFQTYTTALSLLSSLPTINTALSKNYSGTITADLTKIGIWAHSNGGQIALSALAISRATYPTVLWAPVSTSFPYSVLYYTDEDEDQGKALRQTLSGFEDIYNTDLFDPSKYYPLIKAPIEVNQGLSDEEVPYWWSDNLVAALKKDKDDVTYFTYGNSDHNMLPDGWSQAVLNAVSFFNSKLQ